MSAHFVSLSTEGDVQLGLSGNAVEPINILSVSGNGFSQELHHPLHSEKTSTMDASGSGEVLMRPLPMDANIDGMLDITLHHASDIHNICIYGKQDVYAKFSITQTQDTVYSTQPVRGGGKNPVFNQSLQILISKLDAVLKCELWMMSCARNYLEDQLLGFVLVPLCDLMGMGRVTRDYSLTSTELFHTPAGTVCLSLMFYKRNTQPLLSAILSGVGKENGGKNVNVSHMQAGEENGKQERENGKEGVAVDYNKLEFPDLQVASENQQLVSLYMDMMSSDASMDDISSTGGHLQEQDDVNVIVEGLTPARHDQSNATEKRVPEREDDKKLELGALSMEGDCEMASENGDEEGEEEEEKHEEHGSLGSMSHKVGLASNGTLPSLNVRHSERRGVSASKEMDTTVSKSFNSPLCSSSSQATASPRSISSGGGLSSSNNRTTGGADGQESVSSSTADAPPLVSIPLDVEVPVVQQQIVDMYMKSMQQFTESLAKMKLPFDMEGKAESSSGQSSELELEKKGGVSEPGVKDGGHRVFYGSRAFF